MTVALSALLSATMGAAFIILPVLMLVASATFMVLRVRRARTESIEMKDEWAASKVALRDPVTVGVLLLLSGIIVVSFVTGELDLSDYRDLVQDAGRAYWTALTEWDDPLSSRSISFKGGVLVVFMSAAVVLYALIGHFRSRWKLIEKTHLNQRLR
jgi:hypothetical protein